MVHFLRQALAGGKAQLFTILKRFAAENARVAVLRLGTGKWETLINGGSNPHHVPGGYFVYARSSSLMPAPFDLSKLKVTGPAVRVLADLMRDSEGGAALDRSDFRMRSE